MTVRIATSATAYVQEELSSARLSIDELKNCIVQALDLINSSSKRDHFYGIAGELILLAPQALMKLENAVNSAALAMDKLDYEELRQTLRPDKIDELERVLDDVRVRVPRRIRR